MADMTRDQQRAELVLKYYGEMSKECRRAVLLEMVYVPVALGEDEE